MKEILESLMKSEPNKRFVFNVSPRNKKFMKFLQKNGYVISQQTVVKYFEWNELILKKIFRFRT